MYRLTRWNLSAIDGFFVKSGTGRIFRPMRNYGPSGHVPNGVELASEKVAELVKSFEHVNEILDGFRYIELPKATDGTSNAKTDLHRNFSCIGGPLWMPFDPNAINACCAPA